ncbi:MAG: anti-sigma factor [Rhodospirillaceae bacterium]
MRDSDLHAYVDGQLDVAGRIEVETWLAEDEEAARRVDAYRSQNAALHALFDSALNEPLGPRLTDLAEQLGNRLDTVKARRNRWSQPAWTRLAASVVLLLAGLGGGWLGHGQLIPLSAPAVVSAPVAAPAQVAAVTPALERPTLLSFAEEAAQAHSFYAHSRFEVEMGADDQDALNNWLSERLGKPVFAPDLATTGYRLIGGRSLPTDSGTVAQYMYQSDDTNRLTLSVGVPPSDKQGPTFSYAKRGDIASFYWTEGALSYALVGRFDRDRLMAIAQAVHQKLKSGPAPRPAPPQSQPAQETRPPPAPPAEQMVPAPVNGTDQNRPKAS